MLLFGAVALPAFSVASGNGAGGYYSTFTEMAVTRLQQHQDDIARRDTPGKKTSSHAVGLKKEREQNIYRMMNGCEAAVVFSVVSTTSAIAGFVVSWRGTLVLQSSIAAGLTLGLPFGWYGLPHQWPESLWQLSTDGSSISPLSNTLGPVSY